MDDWPILSHYPVTQVREIAMPIGGIGTGSFALGGDGKLTDWQLMGRPHRGWRPPYSHLLLRTWQRLAYSEKTVLRVVESDLTEGLAGDTGATAPLAGIPRFRDASFEASYPFGRARVADKSTPVSAVVEAFNPLLPGDTDASSLPMAAMTVALTNRTAVRAEVSLTLLLSNFIGSDGLTSDLKGNVTEKAKVGKWKGFHFYKENGGRTAQNGTFAVLCDAYDVHVARRWTFRRQPWNGEMQGVLDALLDDGFIPDVDQNNPCPPSDETGWESSLSAFLTLRPKETQTVQLLFTWHFPNRNLAEEGWWSGGSGANPVVGNYYATKFENALDVAEKVLPQLPDLRERTISFVKSVTGRRAPHALKEAALFNLAVLRSPTCFRLADGTFAAWEGCGATSGCCTGSCTHVWNYEEATRNLFPDLHRSMLESHLRNGVTAQGAERFRLSLPIKNQTWNAAAADGQMGLIVRAYQQALADKESGGLEWLKQFYPSIKAMMEFAWVPGGWDADKDGVMEGVQHNTYDVEFYGPNPLCTIWYLAALAACARMARLMDDTDFAAVCSKLRANGSAWVDQNLYNGHYYMQEVAVPKAPPAPMTALGELPKNQSARFQVGQGCLIDQLVGQYKANRAGLGDLLDKMHITGALAAIYKNNFRHNFRDHYNNMRTFAAGDDSGTLICSYPNGERPLVPFPYWSECMTGFEYQLAVLLLDYGMTEEAVTVAKAVRDRHDGAKRNPFSEPECGSYYARSMASWALLDAWDQKP